MKKFLIAALTLIVMGVFTGTARAQTPFPQMIAKLPSVDNFKNFVSYVSSSTWTAPAGVNKAFVIVCGGGGSGAKPAAGSLYGGGGGGGGAMAAGLVGVTAASTYTVTIGAGGAGVTVANTNGNAGGSSTFASLLTANGGSGGMPLPPAARADYPRTVSSGSRA